MTQSFKVHIEQSKLDDLKNRIANTRWIEVNDSNDWTTGVSHSYLKELADYWINVFDWRAVENKINAYPNFITEIDGVKIHYLHIKSTAKNAVPLLISHGWPGSFLEMLKIIPLLVAKDDISFDLVIPSLLGFGFSDKRDMPGMNASLMAELWIKLMKQLEYEKFIAQGGDFGAIISSHIALKHPEVLIGLHLNYIPFNYKPYLLPGEELSKEETAAQQKTMQFFQMEGAYSQIQSTKPRTLAYGLNDDPMGLCAWILQIFYGFSDKSKGLDSLFSQDELLANITLYWLTETIYSSMRLYSENMKDPLNFDKNDFIKTPVGVAHYPFPDSFPAKKYVERGYNIQYWKDLSKGGHFAALEQPELFANDIKEFAKAILS